MTEHVQCDCQRCRLTSALQAVVVRYMEEAESPKVSDCVDAMMSALAEIIVQSPNARSQAELAAAAGTLLGVHLAYKRGLQGRGRLQ